MLLPISFIRSLASRLCRHFLSIILAAFVLFQIPALEAGGWGTTGQTVKYENTTWTEIFFDMNGLNFNAYIPNYSGTSVEDDIIFFEGDSYGNLYMINTFLDANYTPPKTAKEFIKIIKQANPEYNVTLSKTTTEGAVYSVDLTPKNPKQKDTWRFLCTKDRIIQMATTHSDENCRSHFFNSVVIH